MIEAIPSHLVEFSHIHIVKPVGIWIIDPGGSCYTQFASYKKPNWFHRKMTTLILGWEWRDIKSGV